MNWVTRTLPGALTRPTSLRPRSTSIRCSARSFSSARSSASSAASTARIGVAAARPGDGMHRDLARLHLHQQLWRGPGDREIVQREIEHVGRRIDRAQSAIDREGMRSRGSRDPPRRHHLVAVARTDVLLNPSRRLHVGIRLRERRGRYIPAALAWRLAAWRSWRGRAQPALHLVEPRLSLGSC